MKYSYLLIVALLIGMTSCKENGKKFTVKQIDIKGVTTLSYEPQMPLVKVLDSAFYYLSREDNSKVIVAEISRGDIIARTNYYHVRVMVRDYGTVKGSKFEILLRTFSVDGKILDTTILGSTLDGNSCEGVFDGKNTITRTCNNKEETIEINELGKFIIQK